MVKANMRYKKVEDAQLRRAVNLIGCPHLWDKKDLAELQATLTLCEEYRDYWFTRKDDARWSVHREGTLMMATEPNVKLESYRLRGVYATYKRGQFSIVKYIDGGKLSNTRSTEGLKCYLKERAERGEDTLFQEQVDECVRRLKINYEKNTLRRLQRFTADRVTEEYIRENVTKHLTSISQGNGNGFSTNWVEYTMFLQRKEVGRYQETVPILKPKPVMSNAEIEVYMRNNLGYNNLKRDGFSGKAIDAAIPKVVSHYFTPTSLAIKAGQKAARNWCKVWIEILGDEEE